MIVFVVRSSSFVLKSQKRMLSFSPYRLSSSLSEEPRRHQSVRVRFAPSPTGFLHLGGLRTAFINYLFAKSQGGSFILRIEDTDQERTVKGAEEALERVLKWAGIVPDESPSVGGNFGPYRQSDRLELYRDHVDKLLGSGNAYRCFCSEKRLDLLRKEAVRSRSVFRYDGRCRSLKDDEVEARLAQGRSHVVRLKLKPGMSDFQDLVFGSAHHDIYSAEGDPVILKSDGRPTYHLANVVDDHFMAITHVLRGVEWQVSTPKHLMLYDAFGWEPPKYAHLPLLMNPDGTKLSKRQNNLHLDTLRQSGFMVESILNFMSFVGGGFEGREKSMNALYSLEELCQKFKLSKISTHSASVDMEVLKRLNRTAIAQRLRNSKTSQELIKDLRSKLEANGFNVSAYDDGFLEKILRWSQDRIFTVNDLTSPEFSYLWTMPTRVNVSQDLGADVLKHILELIEKQSSFEDVTERIGSDLRALAKMKNVKYASMMKFFRSALIGSEEGPPIRQILEILGREHAIERLEKSLKICRQSEESEPMA